MTLWQVPDAYVLLVTEHDAPERMGEFGEFSVIIQQPRLFLSLNSRRLGRTTSQTFARAGRVTYTPRAVLGTEPLPGSIGFVKPPDGYAEQREVPGTVGPAVRREHSAPVTIDCGAVEPLLRRIR